MPEKFIEYAEVGSGEVTRIERRYRCFDSLGRAIVPVPCVAVRQGESWVLLDRGMVASVNTVLAEA